MKRRKAKAPERKLTLADRQQKEQTRAATDAAIEQIKPLVQEQKHRLLRDLKREEVEGVVIAAIGAWIAERERQSEDEQLKRLLDEPLDSDPDFLLL